MNIPKEKLEKIKITLQKLMALSASPFEAEANSAMEKAKELMETYGIRTVDIDPVSKSFGVDDSTIESMSNTMWEKALAYNIARALDGDTVIIPVYSNGRKTGKHSICFLAGSTDLDMIIGLYTRLRRTVSMFGRSYIMDNRITEDLKKIHESYCYGAVVSIGKNLLKIYMQPSVETTSLVVVKKDAVEGKIAEKFPNVVTRKVRSRSINEFAMMQGIVDGKNIGVHTGVVN